MNPTSVNGKHKMSGSTAVFVILLLNGVGVLCQRSKNVEQVQSKAQIAMMFETCHELNGTLVEFVQGSLNRTGIVTSILKTDCGDTLSFATSLGAALSSGVQGILAVARRDYLDLVHSATYNSSFHVTLLGSGNTLDLITSHTPTKDDSEYTINGRLFWKIISSILKEIITDWNWRNIYIYADQVLDAAGKKVIQDMLQPFWLSTSIKLLQNPRAVAPDKFLDQMLFDEIGLLEAKQMVILCNEPINIEIAKQASARNLFIERYQWLFFSVDSKELYDAAKLRFDSQVVIMRPTPWKNLSAFILDSALDLKRQLPVLTTTVVSTGKGSRGQQQSVISNEEQAGPVEPMQPLSMDLVKVQVRRTRSKPELIHVGRWTFEYGIVVSPYDALSNFDGINIPISTIDSAPYVITSVDKNGHETYSGYLIDLLEMLAQILNFKYNLTRSSENSFGNCQNSTTCDGLVGALVRKEVEIGLANFISSVSLLDYIDFSSHTVDQGGVAILISRPRRTDAMAIWAYFRPFGWPVAILVGVSYVVFAMLLHLTMKTYFHLKWSIEEDTKTNTAELADSGSLSRCTVMSIQGFSQQGIDVVPKNTSSKVVYAVMWVFSVVVMSAYNSNLISYFTVTDVDWPFQTLEELLQKDDYGIVMIKGTTYLSEFEADKESILYRVYKRMAKENFRSVVDDLDTALEHVQNGPVALLHSKRILEFVESKTCNFTLLNVLYLSAPISIAFQKDSQFTKPISRALLRFEESGLTDNLKGRWWPPVSDCDDYNTGYTSVSAWAITSLLAILATGFVTSSIFLLVENVTFKKQAQLRALSAQVKQVIRQSSARLFKNKNGNQSRSTSYYRRSRTPRYVRRFLMFTTDDAIKTLYNNFKNN